MSGFRATIPSSVRKMIPNIKEIAGNHTDDEIYAMLKECSMDPNETTQKLLYQDTFHEVRRKRDRRKENLSTKEPTESRGRQSMQGRGVRGGGRGSYSSRYISHDAGGGMHANSGKENGVNKSTYRGSTSFSPVSQDTEIKATASPVTGMANGSINVDISTHGRESHVSGASGISAPKKSFAVNVNKEGTAQPLPANVKNIRTSVIRGERGRTTSGTPSSEHLSSSMTPRSVSGVYSLALDPVLVPSLDSRVPGEVGTIKRKVGSQQTSVEPTTAIPAESKPVSQEFTNRMQINKLVSHEVANPELSSSVNEKVDSEIDNLFVHGKIPSKSQGNESNVFSEVSQARPSSSHTGSSASRPSSNYSNRSQVIGLQKAAGHSKEWKPKPTNPIAVQPSSIVGTSEVEPIVVGTITQSLTGSSFTDAEEAASKLQKKLEELRFSAGQNVIIPNHLQVPEAERTGLSFGSFDVSFGVSTNYANSPDSDKIATPLSESSQEIEETAEELSSSVENESPADPEGDYSDHPQSPTHMPENLSPAEADVPSAISPGPVYDQSKSETALPPGGPQYSVVHNAPNYSAFGLVPPMLGSQLAPFESSETQARDASRLPSFVVQQPFDPSTSYYTQFYRPNADGDGRLSPFLAPGAASATKYNGNITLLPSQSSPSQENGNSMILSTAGPTPLVTQGAGVMQSSIAVTQQPVPVFRQPAGVHISHYPPNYIPYNQYFPQFYVPPPAIHHFLSNTAFPQQSPTGGIFQPPAAAAAAAASAVKYSLSQYKPGTNAGNTAHIGLPTGYAPYTSTPAGYSPSAAVTTGNSTGNEDLSASPYKENNVYITGQQSESSTVWIPAPGRDISALQAGSFYNLSPQGQHVTFPTQAGHGAFAGIYHPAQTMAAATVHPLLQQSQTMAGSVEIVGPPTGVYQHPQRPQINWANNY